MNFGQLKQRAAVFAGDPAQTRYGSLLSDATNDANKQFALDSKCLFKDAPTYAVVSGTAAYALPSDFMLEKGVTFKGLKLDPITRTQLLASQSDDWTDDVGTPTHFIIDPEEARKQILLYPIPQSDDAGNNLILTYYPEPTTMAADADLPLNGYALLDPYHIAIAYLAAWYVLCSEVATPEILSKLANLNRLYNDKVVEAIDKFKNTASAPISIRKSGRLWI